MGAAHRIRAALLDKRGRVMRAAIMLLFAQAIALPLLAIALRLPTITP